MNVFTYGTLCFPEVMKIVSGSDFAFSPAVLPGYERRLLTGKLYPGVVERAGCSVSGCVWHDVSEEALARLDYFEDEVYERQTVEVMLGGGGKIDAVSYVIPPEAAQLLDANTWSEEDFRKLHLSGYLMRSELYMSKVSSEF